MNGRNARLRCGLCLLAPQPASPTESAGEEQTPLALDLGGDGSYELLCAQCGHNTAAQVYGCVGGAWTQLVDYYVGD